MQLPATVQSFDDVDLNKRQLHLALGMFDGVHLGHQAVIESAIHSASHDGGVSGVLSFWPHPSRVLNPSNPTQLIMPREEKQRVLFELGLDLFICEPFSTELAAKSDDEFVNMLKERLPSLHALYVGENFRFGRGRKGDVEFLVRKGKELGVSVISVPRIQYNGEPISSTRLREVIAEGDVEQACAMLGRHYENRGKVIPGAGKGHDLGFPTLNIGWLPEAKPRLGVYAVQISTKDGRKQLHGVANYGLRPTVSENKEPVLEVHLLNKDDLPSWHTGRELTVEWLKFLRPEKCFDGIEALKKQIAEDKSQAIQYFSSTS